MLPKKSDRAAQRRRTDFVLAFLSPAKSIALPLAPPSSPFRVTVAAYYFGLGSRARISPDFLSSNGLLKPLGCITELRQLSARSRRFRIVSQVRRRARYWTAIEWCRRWRFRDRSWRRTTDDRRGRFGRGRAGRCARVGRGGLARVNGICRTRRDREHRQYEGCGCDQKRTHSEPRAKSSSPPSANLARIFTVLARKHNHPTPRLSQIFCDV
jgi:hypothetical protein